MTLSFLVHHWALLQYKADTALLTLSRTGLKRLSSRAALVAARLPCLLQFSGWFGLGLLAFGAEVMLLGLLYQGLRFPLWLASAVAAEVVLLTRFLTTDRLVFGHARPTRIRSGRFHGAALGSFAVSWMVLNGSAALLGVPYVVATFLGSVAAFGLSAFTNFLWVWRDNGRSRAGS